MLNPQHIRFMIVDPNPSVQEGLATFLGTMTDMSLIASASNGSEAIKEFLEHRPNLVLVDLVLPDMSGIELMQELQLDDQNTKFIFFDSSNAPIAPKISNGYGKVRILRKNIPGATIAKVIRTVMKRKNESDPAC